MSLGRISQPYRPARYNMGTDQTGAPYYLSDEDFDHHGVILGSTGSGKSRCIQRLLRGYLTPRPPTANTPLGGIRGFCLIDPHGDLSEDLMAWIDWKVRVEKQTWLEGKIHYLEPSYEMVFGYDPFKYPDHYPHSEAAYVAWLHTKVDAVSEILQRKQGQMGFEGMPRLQRVLRDVLFATGRAIDRKKRRHLPLADCLVLLDVYHPRHDEVFNLVSPFLSSDIRSDFHMWHKMRERNRPQDLLTQTESTLNRLRSFLGPVVRGIFCDTVNTIDFYEIMQRGEILLVNLRETDFFSADQGNAVGGMFIHEILTTAARTPRQFRRPYSLVVEECGEYIGQDLLRALGAVRKYLLSIKLCGQDLSTFRKGELDMAPKVLSQCGTVVCFQNPLEEDLAILADRIFRGDLNYEELYSVMDRPDGYDLLPMQEHQEAFTWTESWGKNGGNNWTNNWSLGGSATNTDSHSRTKSSQLARQKTWNRSTTRQETIGSGRNEAETDSTQNGDGRGETPIIVDGRVTSMVPVSSRNAGNGRAVQAGRSTQHSIAEGEQEGVGGGTTWSDGTADMTGGSNAVGFNIGAGGANGGSTGWTDGGSKGGSKSVSHKHMMVPKTREEWHPTGRLRHAVADQLEKFKTVMYGLVQGEAVVKRKSDKVASFLRMARVEDKQKDVENKFSAIEKLKKRLWAARKYYHPNLGDEAARIDAYLIEAKFDPAKETPPAAVPISPEVLSTGKVHPTATWATAVQAGDTKSLVTPERKDGLPPDDGFGN